MLQFSNILQVCRKIEDLTLLLISLILQFLMRAVHCSLVNFTVLMLDFLPFTSLLPIPERISVTALKCLGEDFFILMTATIIIAQRL